MKNKFIILGCGNSMGVPRIDSFWGKCKKSNKKNIRTRCSAIIIKGSNSVLIDTSPDIRAQLIKNKIKNISSVIYSHEHADQTNGLFELRPFTFSKNKNLKIQSRKIIDLYGSKKTMYLLKKRFDYCFKKNSIYPQIVKSNIAKKTFSLGRGDEKINIKTLTVKHGLVKSTAYIFNKIAYISDCSDLSIIKMKNLNNLKYLIIDCLKIDKNYAHFNLDECLYINKHLKPKKMILTNLHTDLDYDHLLSILPKNVIPAYDGLKISL
ncbi:MAG: phosphoribosyl 1,2-cyclic phosphate phosphodiesterase [Pelagibacterales bacterium]|nr:phosphoribosyl 1,2-cyclic phosphate phosphodiesterase [Pelagibacterales bacterium]